MMQDDPNVIITLLVTPERLAFTDGAMITHNEDGEVVSATLPTKTGDRTFVVTGWDVECAAYRMVDSERLAHPSHAHLRGKRQIVTR